MGQGRGIRAVFTFVWGNVGRDIDMPDMDSTDVFVRVPLRDFVEMSEKVRRYDRMRSMVHGLMSERGLDPDSDESFEVDEDARGR